jgi:hypothetical protein
MNLIMLTSSTARVGSTMNYDDLILAYKELFPDLNQSLDLEDFLIEGQDSISHQEALIGYLILSLVNVRLERD